MSYYLPGQYWTNVILENGAYFTSYRTKDGLRPNWLSRSYMRSIKKLCRYSRENREVFNEFVKKEYATK